MENQITSKAMRKLNNDFLVCCPLPVLKFFQLGYKLQIHHRVIETLRVYAYKSIPAKIGLRGGLNAENLGGSNQ